MPKLNKSGQRALAWAVSCVASAAITGLMGLAYYEQHLAHTGTVARDGASSPGLLLQLGRP